MKSENEWAEIKEYCEFINDFFTAQKHAISNQATVDIEQFMSKPSTDGKSIFEQALSARNTAIADHNAKNHLDRDLFISDAVADFNAL